MHEQSYRHDMGDGLVARWSTRADREKILAITGFVFREKASDPVNPNWDYWINDLMTGHPLASADDFAVVEDTRTGDLVASLIVMSAEWEYAGIPFTIGRPEAVVSHPEYRNRGLVRQLFAMFHARSTARGQLVQGVTGISYFYRQFGYEYALDLGGVRNVPIGVVPQLKPEQTDDFGLRRATVGDLTQVQMLYERERSRTAAGHPLLTTARIESHIWRWLLSVQSPDNTEGWVTWMIDDTEGRAVGYVLTRRKRWGGGLGIVGFATEPGTSMAAVLPPVLRALVPIAHETPRARPEAPERADTLRFGLGQAHPAYDLLGDNLAFPLDPPYAWYVRVPDLPAFIRRVTPALERRISSSSLSGYTGEVRIDFYRGGLRLVFAAGKLTEVEDWRAPVWEAGAKAGFPPGVFLQLMFGRRSLADLKYAFPDVWADGDVGVLLETLFPKRVSWVQALD